MHRWRRSSLAVILLAVLLTATAQGQPLIDLNINDDNTSTDGLPLVLRAEEEFLLVPENVSFSTPFGLWDNVSVVILANSDGIEDPTVSLDILGALDTGRLVSSLDNVTLSGRYSRQVLQSNNQLETILGNSMFTAFVFYPVGDPDETEFADMFIKSVEYDSHSDIDFVPRNVCFVVSSGDINTVGCMTVRFVGEDDDRPVIDASLASPATFVEGQTDPVLIFNGAQVTVTDPDHPSFLLLSAQAAITTDYNTMNPQERLSLATNFTGITYNFVESSGTLIVMGAATPSVYSQILGNITYYTSMQEPTMRNRTIRVEVFDTVDPGVAANAIVVVININDAALVNFGNSSLSLYYEGNGSVFVAPDLTIVDPDPLDMVTRVVAVLNPLDGSNEHLLLAASSTSQVNVTIINQHSIELTGTAMSSDYDPLLRQLRYEHNDSSPGNPTAGIRSVEFRVTDSAGFEALSILNFTLQPLNDPPVLTLSSAMVVEYTEDDPILPLTSSLSLVDVDSNITEAVFTLTGLLNGQQDQFTFSQSIPAELTLATQDISATTRTLTLSGSARPQAILTVLQSLRYLNVLTNNSVADGNRTAQLVVTDSAGATSNTVTVIVVVEDRNDEPTVMIDDSIVFEEGANSIEIVTQHLVDIMDEEMNNISSIDITLSSPNGQLDENERLFLRTPLFPLLLDAMVTRTQITLEAIGTVEQYEEVLRAVRYINQEDEPTCFVSGGEERLQRVITIMITDNDPVTPSTVTHVIGLNITLINDNAPRLVLRSDCPGAPPVGIFSSSFTSIHKRDTSSLRPHRLLQLKKRAISGQHRPAPFVVSAIPSYSARRCLTNITITFSTDTSTPPVEVQRDLQDVMTFQPSHFNTIPRHGVWLNQRKLLILLDRCYQHSDSSQEIYLMFENQQGDCTQLTECTSGICYSNKTGCPLIGLVPIPYVLTPVTARVESVLPSEGRSVLPYIGIALAAVTVALIATVVVVILLRSKYSRGSHLESDEQKPLTSSNTAPTSYSSIADSLNGESKHASSDPDTAASSSNHDAASSSNHDTASSKIVDVSKASTGLTSEAVSTIIDVTSDTASSKSSDKITDSVSTTSETISDTVNTRQKEETEEESKEEEHSSEGTNATETLTSQQTSCIAAGCRSHPHTAPVDVPPHYHQHPHTITHTSGSQTSNPEPQTNRHSPRPASSGSIDHRD